MSARATAAAAPPAAAPRAPKTSGSQRRQRSRTIGVAVTGDEQAAITAKAQAAGLSLASFARASMLGDAGPRAQRAPPVNAELLAHAVAQLNKAGNNLNQIAHALNAGRAAGAKESAEALAEVRAAVAQILDATGRKDRP